MLKYKKKIIFKINNNNNDTFNTYSAFQNTQREGAALQKALSPQVRCLVLSGWERRFTSVERRLREGVWRWSREVRQGKRGLCGWGGVLWTGCFFYLWNSIASCQVGWSSLKQWVLGLHLISGEVALWRSWRSGFKSWGSQWLNTLLTMAARQTQET